MLSRREALALSTAAILPRVTPAAHPTDVFAADSKPTDPRLGALKTLNDHHPFTPPKTLVEWEARREAVRKQLLVTVGLHPMPAKTPLNAVVHGKIERDGYTIEKVFFASLPGHYVSGNLYRPTGDAKKPHPGILFAHGHWENGRLHDAGEKAVKKDVPKAEKTAESARYPLQALPAALAKMGFVVFHYDMVGVADSTAIGHGAGFADAAAELRLQSAFGLQTWNSIRALDFITSLTDVDPKKIGMTGASGGGTQTFILTALDDRIAVAGPAVMVSARMQGGCVCENASLLRVGTGNVELAAVFAPKPMALTCADDWTKTFPTDGFPELRQIYNLYGKAENVAVKAWPEFGHNYNQPAREFVYAWFRKHLQGIEGPVEELPFMPVPPKELSVYDAAHPRPTDELKADKLRAEMAKASDAQLAKPDAAIIRGWVTAVTGGLPAAVKPHAAPLSSKHEGAEMHRTTIGRPGEPDAVPMVGLFRKDPGKRVVIWVHPDGKKSLFDGDAPSQIVQRLTQAGFSLVAPDVFGTGEATPSKPRPVNKDFAGYTYGYNRRPLADQVRDILTAVAFATKLLRAETVHLVGWGRLGVATAIARSVAGTGVAKTAADLDRFDFASITKADDPMLLPGALKYGGLGAVIAACAPAALLVHNHTGTGTGQASKAAYATAPELLVRESAKRADDKVIDWLIG